jgi:hypothetical protein
MLRVVGKRSFSTCGAFQGIKRTPTSHLRHSNGAAFKHYRVRFLKPPMFSRRRLGTVILYATPLIYFSYFNSPISVEIVAEDKEVVTEDGSVEFQDEIADEDLEDGLFLPFTWPKPCERTYYKGSDPVWKEYIKFNRDRDRQKEVIGT